MDRSKSIEKKRLISVFYCIGAIVALRKGHINEFPEGVTYEVNSRYYRSKGYPLSEGKETMTCRAVFRDPSGTKGAFNTKSR